MIIEVSNRKHPTITTLRELYEEILGIALPSHEMEYETNSLRSRRTIRFTDAPKPEPMLIRDACKRIVAVGEKVKGEKIEVIGVSI